MASDADYIIRQTVGLQLLAELTVLKVMPREVPLPVAIRLKLIHHHAHPVGKPLLSGGATGPEGSIVILPIILLIVAVIVFTLPRTSAGYIRLWVDRVEQ